MLTDKSTIGDKKKVRTVKISPSPSASISAKLKLTPTADNPKKNITAVQVPTATEEAQNLEPSTSTAPPDAGDNECFPVHATVELEDGSSVPMTAIRIGDRVRTGNESFSDVFMFSHTDKGVHAKFVHLFTSSGNHLVLTPSHYLYSNGKLAAEGTVKVGDELLLGNGLTTKWCLPGLTSRGDSTTLIPLMGTLSLMVYSPLPIPLPSIRCSLMGASCSASLDVLYLRNSELSESNRQFRRKLCHSSQLLVPSGQVGIM